MPNKHKTPLLGWHPPAELAAWARSEAKRRDVPLKDILNEALTRHRDYIERQRSRKESTS